MMMWSPSQDGVWLNELRVGEVGGNATRMGYYGCMFSPDNQSILGYDARGGWHGWNFDISSKTWKSAVHLQGHFRQVTDLRWSLNGQALVTCSLDQSTRVHAAWTRQEKGQKTVSWHEVARPQVHGYDINCLSFVNPTTFVSGAEEKVLRVFAAPRTFVQSIASIRGVAPERDLLDAAPIGANTPALGLSNKAVFQDDTKNAHEAQLAFSRQSYLSTASTPTSLEEVLASPPTDEHLHQHTLWPEVDKLYGHGYELISVSANHSGTFVVSACKAAKPEHAGIRVWNTKDWQEVSILRCHSLTVTCLQFSPNDQYLVSVGRDRGVALWKATGNDLDPYSLVQYNPKAHSRIIWAITWTPDASLFITASRDKSIKIWDTLTFTCVDTIKFDDAVTALDCYVECSKESEFLVAVGMESGSIRVLKGNHHPGSWVEITRVPESYVLFRFFDFLLFRQLFF